jgi:gliding motility-associated protein GldM
MAGGKETPRQKLIGMMYLVLTALLALNVSVTVLDKFIDINRSLEVTRDAAREQNVGTIRRIQQAVEESGSRPDDVKILDAARTIRDRTKAMIDELEEYKKIFVEITGGVDATGDLKGKTDYDKVGNYMMVDGGKGNGAILQKSLNEYAAFLSSKIDEEGVVFPPLARDAKDDPIYKDRPNQAKMDWSSLQFMGAPTPAGLATITQIQNEVMAYEARALDALARKVGAADLKFDLISLVALPESKVVAAGAKYRADLFISAASSAAENPEMTFEGKPIPVEGGKGKIEFIASGGSYDKDGLVRKTYKATVTLKDSVYAQDIEYFVAKPVIQVQSAALNTLYLNCGNKLNVMVPQLGVNYNPTFSATGGQAITGTEKGVVTIVPNAPKVELTVRQEGNILGTVDFKVQPIPKPSIVYFNGNRPVNVKQGEGASSLRVIRVEAQPELNFKQNLPDDARYRVASWTITLARGPRPVGAPLKATTETVNISQLMSQARPGDRLVVEIDRVQRLNFRGQTEDVQIGQEGSVSITLN